MTPLTNGGIEGFTASVFRASAVFLKKKLHLTDKLQQQIMEKM